MTDEQQKSMGQMAELIQKLTQEKGQAELERDHLATRNAQLETKEAELETRCEELGRRAINAEEALANLEQYAVNRQVELKQREIELRLLLRAEEEKRRVATDVMLALKSAIDSAMAEIEDSGGFA
jgi:hypothetical protein